MQKNNKRSGKNEYLRQLSMLLPWMSPHRKDIMKEAERRLSEIPNAQFMSYEILNAVAGNPQQFLEGIIDVQHISHRKRRLAFFWVPAIVVLLIALIGLLKISNSKQSEMQHGYVEFYDIDDELPSEVEDFLRQQESK